MISNKFCFKYCEGFTLAEVLIVLAVIGVVAALTVPNLISNYKKNVAIARLKEAYSLLNNAYKLSVADNGNFLSFRHNKEYTDNLSKQDFDKYFRKYLKITKDCESLISCGYSSDNPFTRINSDEVYEFVTTSHTRAYLLSNGMVLFYRDLQYGETGGFAFNNIFLSVDINGPSGPNKTGVDLFLFSIIYSYNYNSVMPRLHEWGRSNVEDECTNLRYGGSSCTAKIMFDGWKFADNYPYKF